MPTIARPAPGGTAGLLACGAAAGPVFVVAVAAQTVGREGFDPRRHPISLLSRGELGWVQVGAFVVTGVLIVAYAVGARRVLRPGSVGSWAPPLIGLLGAGLVAAGVFVTDPGGLGFPPGDPGAGPSWQGTAHSVGTAVALNSGLLACLVLARRFALLGRRRWAAYSVATAAVVAALGWWPGPVGVSLRLAGVVVALSAWVCLTAVSLRRELVAGAAGGAGTLTGP